MVDRAAVFTYTPLTDDAVLKLAQDIVAGRVFGTWNIPVGEEPSSVFLVLAMMEPKRHREIQAAKISHCYEYLDSAGPRGTNGLPVFSTIKWLNDADVKRVNAALQKCR
jgi:hypothetical protein